MREYWTKNELEFLKTNYNSLGATKIAKILNRTIYAIITKANRLNLTVDKELIFYDKISLEQAVKKSYTYKDVLLLLNKSVSGDQYEVIKKYIKKYNGLGLKVSDEEILNASKTLTSMFGVFSEPAASTAYAGFLKLQSQNMIKQNEKVLILLTGSGLKDLNAVQPLLHMPAPVEANIGAVEQFLNLKK